MKTLIRNTLGNKTLSFSLPADDTVAQTFCATALDGEFAGFVENSVVGSDVGITSYNDVMVIIKNEAGAKTYLPMALKSNMSEADIYAALLGKTFNTVKADYLYITKMTAISLA